MLALKLSEREVQLVGEIHRVDFTDKWHTRNFSYGDRMVVPHRLLKPVDGLFGLPGTSAIPY